MKLLKLSLENFKGIRSLELDLDGHDAAIYGTNATGKTTIADGISWLLFDKPSTDEKGFSPKPRDSKGEEIHNVDSKVEAVFSTDGGNILLTKTFREVWTKKRGSTEAVFGGHTIEYALDGVPVSKGQYDDRLEQLIPRDLAQLLVSPTYFAEGLSWQARRELLLKICGDVSLEEVLQANPELEELRELLCKPAGTDLYTVDEYRDIARIRLKKLNDRLKELPARMDEARKGLSGEDADQKEYLELKLKHYRGSALERQKELAALKASGPALAIRQKIQAIQAQEMDARQEWSLAGLKENEAVTARLNEANAHLEELSMRLKNLIKWSIPDAETELKRLEEMREKLNAQYREVKARTYPASENCPYCGQPLPEEKYQEALARFNQEKSKELERIVKSAEPCSRNEIAAQKDVLAKMRLHKVNLEAKTEALEEEVKELKSAQKPQEPFEATGTYISLQAQMKALKEDMTNAERVLRDEAAKLQHGIDADNAEARHIEKQLADIDADERTRARISDLDLELKNAGIEYEKAQHGLDLCDLYTKTKISMLDHQINSKFHTVSFQLFESQINGGIKECCKVLVPGPGSLVRYESANHAARINAGLEIIDTLAEHFGHSLPVFVDNAESVVSLAPVRTQVIRLVVSESDPRLRVEINH